MVLRVLPMQTFALCLLIASCTPVVWHPNERTGLKSSGKLISVPLNPERPREGSFDLYYFVMKPDDGKLGEKTVLFCSGGPGELVQPDDANTFVQFLKSNGYNIVYFHLRGSGFSQIPQSIKYD